MIRAGDVVKLVPSFGCGGTRKVAEIVRGRFGYLSLLRGPNAPEFEYAVLEQSPITGRRDAVRTDWLEVVT